MRVRETKHIGRKSGAAAHRLEVSLKKFGLPPVLDQNTEVLILGSLPSDISLSKGEYYGNPHNDFWKILAEVLGQSLTTQAYGERLQILLKHKIGLWDVYHRGVRPGSMDRDITETDPNDFGALKADAPKLKLVCFNGKNAGESEGDVRGLGYETVVLPSSSSANRTDQEGRIIRWKTALQPWISPTEAAIRAIEKALALIHSVQTLEGTDKDGVEHLLEMAVENLRK
jgi:hypoxanthine-DNA glycosylase